MLVNGGTSMHDNRCQESRREKPARRGEGSCWGVGVGVGGGGALTLFNILRAAGESGVYRIFPISRGLTEFHTIFVSGLDSSVCIRPLQKGAAGKKDALTLLI